MKSLSKIPIKSTSTIKNNKNEIINKIKKIEPKIKIYKSIKSNKINFDDINPLTKEQK